MSKIAIKKEQSLDSILTAYEAYNGSKYIDSAELREYRAYLCGVFARSRLVRVNVSQNSKPLGLSAAPTGIADIDFDNLDLGELDEGDGV